MKLYWKVKVNGKWTFRAATITGWTTDGYGGIIVEPYDGLWTMKLKCRKCGIVFTLASLDSWQDVNDIQMMQCGAGGVHRVIGVK